MLNLKEKEGELSVRVLEKKDLEEAYKLRYEIFCKELKWLPLNAKEEDKDQYDEKAVHFGVFNKESILIGYNRIVLPKNPFMVEEVFIDLIKNYNLSKKEEDIIEISRLGVRKEYRNSTSFGRIDLLLCKLIYFWSLENKIRYWLMVVRTEYLNSIRNILPCNQIGDIKYYQKGVGTIAAIIDLREAENHILKENPSLYKWFLSK